MIIEKFEKQHVDDAVKLILDNYRQEVSQVPSLPDIDFTGRFRVSLVEMAEKRYGVAAVERGELVGFLSGAPVDAFKGLNRGIYCGITAHGVKSGKDKKDIYQRLYSDISEIWVRNGCLTHAISVFAHDEEAVNTWFHLGFGNRCIDAVRPLTDIAGIKPHKYLIRRATVNDAEHVLPLKAEIREYFTRAPLFMPLTDIKTLEDRDLTSGGKTFWMALDGERPVAYIEARKGGEYPFVAEEEGTVNICGAYAVQEARGTGLSAAMLDTVVRWAKDAGYKRLGVDYESFNRYGSRFWEKHFTPFAYCMFRKLDERILWANGERLNGVVI